MYLLWASRGMGTVLFADPQKPLNYAILSVTMRTGPTAQLNRRRQRGRRAVAVFLAALWGVYALVGAAGIGQCMASTFAANLNASGRTCAPTAAPAPVMHCSMCHGTKRCCCAVKGVPPAPQAVLRARCDRSVPAVAAAVTSWPVTLPKGTASVPAHLVNPSVLRASDQSAVSRLGDLLTPPPCLR